MTTLTNHTLPAKGGTPNPSTQQPTPKSRGKLFIISGPSRVGKDTIVRRLWRERSLNLARIITNTTRAMRPREKRGVTYNFLLPKKFESLIKRGELLEWARVRQAYFGTPKRAVLTNLARGKNVLLQIDVQGAAQIKAKLPKTILIFVTAESPHEIRRRIFVSTKMTRQQKIDRWNEAQRELKAIPRYQYVIVNRFGKLTSTLREIRTIIRRELKTA